MIQSSIKAKPPLIPVIICFILIFAYEAQCQIKELVSSGGNQTSKDFILSESVGQVFVHNVSHKGFSLSEGFQQHHKIKVFKNTLDTSFKIYPNPVRHILNVESSEKLHQILIFNELGSRIKAVENIDNFKYQLNLYEYTPGVYFIKMVDSNHNVSIQKIIKT